MFKLSPNHTRNMVNTAKHGFPVGVFKMKTDSNWESFRETRSVNRFTVIKTVERVKFTKKDERLITVKVEIQEGTFVFREIFRHKKRIIVYGEIYSLRADGIFRKIGADAIRALKDKKDEKRLAKKPKLDNEIKTVIWQGRTVHIIRKNK